nr:hypothetical protein Q903MT_gene6146 [Picea sitchensis]
MHSITGFDPLDYSHSWGGILRSLMGHFDAPLGWATGIGWAARFGYSSWDTWSGYQLYKTHLLFLFNKTALFGKTMNTTHRSAQSGFSIL